MVPFGQIFMLLKTSPAQILEKAETTKIRITHIAKLGGVLDFHKINNIIDNVFSSNNCFVIMKICCYVLTTGCFVKLSRIMNSGFDENTLCYCKKLKTLCVIAVLVMVRKVTCT